MNEPITVLVAEDEPALLRHVCAKLRQVCPAYRLVGAAENGAQALEMARAQRPDVVVTDIRMPMMDGLALIGALRRSGAAFEAIVMSGYDDFDYAKEAMRLGVREYLLKPVTAEALGRALGEAADAVSLSRRQRRAELMLEVNDQRSASGEPDGARYAVFLLCYGNRAPGGAATPSEAFDEKDICAVLGVGPDATWLLPERGSGERLLIVRAAPDTQPLRMAGQILREQWGRENLTVTASGRTVPRGGIGREAETLRAAEEARLRPWRGGLIRADAPAPNPGDPMLTSQEKSLILGSLLAGRASGLHDALVRLLYERWAAGVTQQIFSQLVSRILDLCFSACSDRSTPAERSAASAECAAMIGAASSLNEFADALFERVGPLLFRDESRPESRESAALRVRSFLRGNYMKDVSLAGLAELAGMDPASLARVFRSVCGDTPMKYLISLRIEAAQKLIPEHPELSVRAIGEMVGYPDPFHFSKTFKKLVGLSPSEYREASRGGTM